MRVRIRSSSRVSPRHVSPAGSRETNTVPGAASSPIRALMRCHPGGVRNEPAAPPIPARAVETGHAPAAFPSSNQTANWRSVSTTSSRSGSSAGAPGRVRPGRARSSARAASDGSDEAVTRAFCHKSRANRNTVMVCVFAGDAGQNSGGCLSRDDHVRCTAAISPNRPSINSIGAKTRRSLEEGGK